MNYISEQILQAAEILADEKIKQLKFDKTVQAKIYSVVDLDIGEYKVKYNGNIFSAFANDLNQTYKVEDWVYLNVPEGDFSGKKIIISQVTKKSLSQSQLTSLKNSIFEISPEFSQLYGGIYESKDRYGVIAGVPKNSENSRNYIYKGPETFQSTGFHGLFQQYSNNYELIKIEASFSTQFYMLHNKGNYGLEIEFYSKGDDIVSYRLDLNAFNGDPYRLSVASPQSTIIKVQKNYLLGLKSIKLFEEDFEYDRYVKNGQITNESNMTEPNIFVQDINLHYVDQKDLSDTNYYLMIAAPRGIAFTSNISSLDLQARLIYMGEDIIDKKSKCQWYERDLTVMIGEESYDKEVGFGWKAIEGATDTILSIDSSKVIHSKKYKLKVYYGEQPVVLFAEIEVFNHNNSYDYSIEQKTNDDDIRLQLNNKLSDELLVGDWFLSYPDGSYSFITGSEKKNSVSVSEYLKYSSVKFYCQIYDYSKTNIIGTLEHTITSSESEQDVTITYTGEDTFRYDANGDIAVEDSEKERTLQVNLAWKEGVGTAYTVQWLMRDEEGKELLLTNNEYEPSFSMIDKVWVDNYNILHYNIKQKYKVNFNNNTVIVKITTITEQEYFFDKEILFLKDGDQGTNGTTYALAVRPYDENTGLKLSGFNPLIYNNGWVRDKKLPLRCYVYKDGELINQNSKYDISYRWTGVNVSFDEHNVENNISAIIGQYDKVKINGLGIINSSSTSNVLQFYVKVQVTVNDKMNGRKTEIYASYPVDVIVGGLDVSIVDISSIPSYIKYTASGITPQFYSNNINFIYDNDNKTGSINPMNPSILNIETRDNLYYLKPATNFIFENIKNNKESSIGVLKCVVTVDQFIIHPVIMYLDTYGNEAINGWDGTALDTGEGKYVFAPQVGAGIKDSFNRFTGVVMGKDSSQDKIGLYGYRAGLNTFGIMEDGKAYFGAKSAGGQIVIDGRYAVLHGGDVKLNESSGMITPAANGMYIQLADLNPDKDTKAIGIGYSTHKNENGVDVKEENFFVTYSGKLRATEANIQGDIFAVKGQIGGSQRQGGWTIDSNRLYSGSGTSRVELNSDQSTEYAIWAGRNDAVSAPFYVKRNGYLFANNVKVKGNIEADTLTANKEGTIGGWKISSRSITSARSGSEGIVGMASSGNAVFWIGGGMNEDTGDNPRPTDENYEYKPSKDSAYFLVTRSGKLYCANAEVRGKITANSGEIAGWRITSSGLYSPDRSVYLSATGGFKAGSNFSVSAAGDMTARNAIITGNITATTLTCYNGIIGGWTIGESELFAGNTYLNANGLIATDYFQITGYGTIGAVSTSSGMNLGIMSNRGAVVEGTNVRLTGSTGAYVEGSTRVNINGGRVNIDGSELHVDISAENQHGIYARFA